MLHALKSQLHLLSESDAQQFRDILKRRVGSRKAKAIEPDLRNFILVIPEMLSQIRAWVEDPSMPKSLRQLHGFVLTYIYHPSDYLPEDQYGFFGYIDDAYLVGSVYFHTLENIDRTKVRFLPNQSDLATQVPEWLVSVQRTIPAESRKIDRLLKQLQTGQESAFAELMQSAA